LNLVGVGGSSWFIITKGKPMKAILLLLVLCFACSHIEMAPAPSESAPTAIEVISPDPESTKHKDVFISQTSIKSLNDAIAVANCVVRSEAFLKEIGAFAKYDYTDLTPSDVEASFRNIKTINVSSYKTKNPYSKVFATTYASEKTTFYINTRKLPRTIGSLTNTIIHESSHLINFSHGDNSSVGKERSVPYGAGAIGEKHVDGCVLIGE
jgi:hypothetical protein